MTKLKEYKTLLIVLLIVFVLGLGTTILIQIDSEQEVEDNVNHIKYFEIPDRIVYKEKGKDKYYVFTSAKTDYDELLQQLIKCIDGVGEGARLTKEEMKKIEQEENYIELDYDTISKNYVIAYEKENYNVIKRTDEGGIVVKNNLKQEEELKKLLKEQVQNKKECYSMADHKEYKVVEPISYEVPSWSNELKKYEPGIYSVRLGTKEALEKFVENNQLMLPQEIGEQQFENTNVIATITKYQVEKIETRVGGATLYFKGIERKDQYYVNVYCLSKAVNSNCIYRDFTQITTPTVESIQESKDTATNQIANLQNTGPISQETAKQIAINSLHQDGITTYTDMQIEKRTENKYYLEKWTDSNQNYTEKYTPTNEYEAVDTWYIAFQDAGDPGCYVGVWIDMNTGEVLCYHWTGE